MPIEMGLLAQKVREPMAGDTVQEPIALAIIELAIELAKGQDVRQILGQQGLPAPLIATHGLCGEAVAGEGRGDRVRG
jgi:hypothetical protein